MEWIENIFKDSKGRDSSLIEYFTMKPEAGTSDKKDGLYITNKPWVCQERLVDDYDKRNTPPGTTKVLNTYQEFLWETEDLGPHPVRIICKDHLGIGLHGYPCPSGHLPI